MANVQRSKMTPAYRFALEVLRPPMMAMTKRDWQGAEHLPTSGGFVVVSNHISHFDPLAFAHFLIDNGQVPHFLGKVEVFKVPFVGAVLRGAEQIPVYRETPSAAGAYRAAVDAVRAGKCVGIYPEGTLTRDPQMWPMKGKTGAARIALETGCPVIPVGQWGAHQVLHPYANRPDILSAKTMHMRVGPPVPLTDLLEVPMTREVLEEATDRIMRAICDQLAIIRGEEPPAELYDPRARGDKLTGDPRKKVGSLLSRWRGR